MTIELGFAAIEILQVCNKKSFNLSASDKANLVEIFKTKPSVGSRVFRSTPAIFSYVAEDLSTDISYAYIYFDCGTYIYEYFPEAWKKDENLALKFLQGYSDSEAKLINFMPDSFKKEKQT